MKLSGESLICYCIDEDLYNGQVKSRTSSGESPRKTLQHLQWWLDNDGSDYVTPVSSTLGISIQVFNGECAAGYQEICYFAGNGCVRKAVDWLKNMIA